MVNSRRALPEEPERLIITFAMKCVGWIQRAEQQKVCAREMIEMTRKMCDRAQQMSKPLRFALPYTRIKGSLS